ncbi:hypothetical protein; putative vacuolar ATP synthase 16 kDa proteolipid subunit fragment [Bradyrhizobium sp. ORS 278]|nr:hypothetical protein [Bradyrhizobium sp. ORS 278]CAL77432.1 hypothetical protein; putative vacuolar ATP synthase 16 kDa proteolipid subunit fragment [Bradyrhizobium sp. ORS 278]
MLDAIAILFAAWGTARAGHGNVGMLVIRILLVTVAVIGLSIAALMRGA